MTLTLDEVRKTKFHMARRTGYEVSEVDLFVDRVEASFAQLTEENQMLKQQVEALKQAQTRQPQQVRGQFPTDETRRPGEPQESRKGGQQSRPQPAAEPPQKLVVSTSADASPAVVRLVQLATEQSEQLVNEANAEATRKIDEANRKAGRIAEEARTKAERLESDSKAAAERMTNEARGRVADLDRQTTLRRTELFASLERERDQLQEAVGQLRGFEADYRQSFASHLKQQLQAVENVSVEPANKPSLADRTKGNTPAPARSPQPATGGHGGNT